MSLLFAKQDVHLFEIVVRGESTVRRFRNADVRQHLPDKSPGLVSRMLESANLMNAHDQWRGGRSGTTRARLAQDGAVAVARMEDCKNGLSTS
jgi:hypothetical protein